MRKSVRSALALAGAAALVAGMTACGNGGGAATPESGAGEGGTDAGEVTLSFVTWIPTIDQWPAIVEEFEAQNPGIKIDFRGDDGAGDYFGRLDNLILAGDTPDVFGMQTSAAMADYAEFTLPAQDYAADWLDKLSAEALEETTTADGHMVALPVLTAGSEFMLYNQTLLDELGLSLPTSYEDLMTVAGAARQAGLTGFAMGAADAWHDVDFFVWMSNQFGEGGDIYKAAAGEIPWDSPTLVEAATAWQKLFTDGAFQDAATSTTTYPSARDDYFLARKAIAMPTGSWHVSATIDGNGETPGSAVEGDEIGMAAFPTVGPNDTGATSGVDFAISLSYELEGEKLEAAKKFAEFMTVGDGAQIWINTLQGFPAATDLAPQLQDQPELAVESVARVSDALQASTFQRKLKSETNMGLENDLGVVLQNIANGADPAKELATLN